MSEFSKMVRAFQKTAGVIGKTFTGSENLQNITAGVAPTPNLNYNITQFKPSLPGLNPALTGTPNIPSLHPNLNAPSMPDWMSIEGGSLGNLNTDIGTLNLEQDWLKPGGGTLGTAMSAFKGSMDTLVGMDQRSGIGLALKGLSQTGDELNKFLFGGNIQKYGEHWKRQMIGNEEDVWSDNTTTTTTTDDGGSGGGTVTSGPGEAPDTSEEAAALMSGAAKPGEMLERDRLARIRRMLAGRYGRAETQLTKGGFGEGTGRSLTGYA